MEVLHYYKNLYSSFQILRYCRQIYCLKRFVCASSRDHLGTVLCKWYVSIAPYRELRYLLRGTRYLSDFIKPPGKLLDMINPSGHPLVVLCIQSIAAFYRRHESKGSFSKRRHRCVVQTMGLSTYVFRFSRFKYLYSLQIC